MDWAIVGPQYVSVPHAGSSGPVCAHGWGIYDSSICLACLSSGACDHGQYLPVGASSDEPYHLQCKD